MIVLVNSVVLMVLIWYAMCYLTVIDFTCLNFGI